MNKCPRCQNEDFVKMVSLTKTNAINVNFVGINGRARHPEDIHPSIKGCLCFYIAMAFQCMLSQNFLMSLSLLC